MVWSVRHIHHSQKKHLAFQRSQGGHLVGELFEVRVSLLARLQSGFANGSKHTGQLLLAATAGTLSFQSNVLLPTLVGAQGAPSRSRLAEVPSLEASFLVGVLRRNGLIPFIITEAFFHELLLDGAELFGVCRNLKHLSNLKLGSKASASLDFFHLTGCHSLGPSCCPLAAFIFFPFGQQLFLLLVKPWKRGVKGQDLLLVGVTAVPQLIGYVGS